MLMCGESNASLSYSDTILHINSPLFMDLNVKQWWKSL